MKGVSGLRQIRSSAPRRLLSATLEYTLLPAAGAPLAPQPRAAGNFGKGIRISSYQEARRREKFPSSLGDENMLLYLQVIISSANIF